LKGFTKDGKFRPTGNRNKSSLKKSDIKEHQFADDRIGRTLPITRKKVGSCKTCGMKFTAKDYENASAGKESPVGDYDDECYPCQLKMKKSLDGYQDKRTPEAKENQHSIIERKESNKQSLDIVEDPKVSKELKKIMKEEVGADDVVAFSYNPKWKLTHLYEGGVNGAEYYHFPDEESALEFGRQSIKDTGGDYFPDDKDSPEYKKMDKMSDEGVVDYIIEMQSNYGDRSELGAIAQSVASYDGQYIELSDGSIVFQIG